MPRECYLSGAMTKETRRRTWRRSSTEVWLGMLTKLPKGQASLAWASARERDLDQRAEAREVSKGWTFNIDNHKVDLVLHRIRPFVE